MTPLSEALTAAQRSALAALEKAYVAGQIEPEAMSLRLESFGISDPVDTAYLLTALDVLREWGVSAPTMTERVTEAKNDRATKGQLDFISDLCKRLVVDPPEAMESLTKEQASAIIERLKAGTYKAEEYRVPFERLLRGMRGPPHALRGRGVSALRVRPDRKRPRAD